MPVQNATDAVDLVDTSEAMGILGTYRTAVLRHVERGALPYVQRGRRGKAPYTFRRSDVEALRDRLAEYRRLASTLGVKAEA